MATNSIKQIYSFGKKELLFLIRYPVQVVAELILPVINILPSILLAFALTNANGLEYFHRQSGTENFVAFMAIGIVFHYFNDIQEQTGYMLQKEMWIGTLEQIWFSPINKIIIIFGWIIFAMFKALIYTSIGLLFINLMGLNINIALSEINIVSLSISFICLGFSTIGIGMIISSIVLTMRNSDAFVYLVTALIPIFSGVVYPITILPKSLQYISTILPTTYAYDLIRYSFLKTNTLYSLKKEYLVLLLLTLLFVGFGLFLFHKLRRRVEVWGTIWLN